MRNKILIVLLMTSFYQSGYAFFEKKLNFYECDNQFQISSCTSGCKKDNKLKFEFIVDKNNSRVMQKIYSGSDVLNSVVFESCKIFDSKNWDCSAESTFYGISDTFHRKMNNGIYSSYHAQIKVSKNNQATFKDSNFVCAK